LNANSEARLGTVHPQLASRVRKMAAMLLEEDIEIEVVQALRSWTEQAALYAKGRDDDGNIVDKSQVVTNAKPGHSWHNFGLAVDVSPFDEGIPDWNSSHPAWKRIIAVGESLGLVSGANWRSFPDAPHFQFTGQLPLSPTDAVRTAYETGGQEEIWKRTGLDAG
jgi:peptidoglycan L-alanyl-D-glutamate endopeptidase CwlK